MVVEDGAEVIARVLSVRPATVDGASQATEIDGDEGLVMQMRWIAIRVGLFAALATMAFAPMAVAGVVLITPEEATLPLPKQLVSSRAVTRGPRIEAAIEDGTLRSPLRFKLIFRAFGGSTVDPSTLVVTYLRGSNIDLTQRVKKFVQPGGIDVPDAEVPPGEHAIRVEVKDSDGRTGTANVFLAVAPN
jgi:hypothetical protein